MALKEFLQPLHIKFSGPAVDRIQNSVLEQVIVTDTIPLRPEAKALSKIKVLSTASLLAEAITQIHNYDSVSSLFS